MKIHRIQKPMSLTALAIGFTLSLFTGATVAGPGTQTEDDVYVGIKRKAQRVTTPTATPGTAAPQPKPAAGVSPNTAALQKKKALSGGDDDLDDLELERLKARGANKSGKANP